LLCFVFFIGKPPMLFTVSWEVKPLEPIRDGSIVNSQSIVILV
jgi:hypothetical protein